MLYILFLYIYIMLYWSNEYVTKDILKIIPTKSNLQIHSTIKILNENIKAKKGLE